jgi:hypothetical protein
MHQMDGEILTNKNYGNNGIYRRFSNFFGPSCLDHDALSLSLGAHNRGGWGWFLARFVALARPKFAPSGRKLRIPASRYLQCGITRRKDDA